MKFYIIRSIAKKEFYGFINSALAYTIIVPFLLLSIFIYTNTALVAGEATLRPYFELLPWFLVLIAPALAMKLISEENKVQTLELVFAHPVSELELVLGKFLGTLAFYAVILLTTIGLPVSIIFYSRPDIGQILGQYIGALFMGALFISIGMAASSYMKNVISSFLLGASISFVFIIIGLDFVTQSLLPPLGLIASQLSVLTHIDNIARGLLDIRDLFYFLSAIAAMLMLAIMRLAARKTAENKLEARKLNLALMLIVGIGFVSNLILYSYPLRIDLTQARLYSLSEGTRQTLGNLDDIVTITLYSSSDLPSQMQLVSRDVADTLKDYQRLSGKLKVQLLYPKSGDEASRQAASQGIKEVQFNSMSSGKFEVQAGILGLVIRYGDKTESIPFIQDTSDLEYQLTRRIGKLTSDKEQVIGIYQNGFNTNNILNELLSTQYKVETLAVDDMEKTKNISSMIVIDDGNQESTASAMIKNYLENGGKVLFLTSGAGVSSRSLSAQKSVSDISEVYREFGVGLNKDLVYDLQLSELLNFSGEGGQRYLLQYPYWLRALPQDESFGPLTGIKSISMGWPSSLTIENKKDVRIRKLLATGVSAGKVTDNFDISPQSVSALTANSKDILLGVLAEKGNNKLIVIGSDTPASDQFMQNSRDNISFISNAVDYLSADKDIASIPSKTQGRPVFEFESPSDIYVVRYGNLFIPPLLVIVFALIYLRRRKILTRRVYEK